jgi:hypothetical protein
MTTLIPKFDLKDGGSTPTGAVNRPINEKLSEWISVKDFGAIGNGTTDDTVAINAALTAAGALSPRGTVVLPPGFYKTTDTLDVPIGVTLTGEGNAAWSETAANRSGAIIYPFHNNDAISMVGDGTNTIGGEISNLYIYCNADAYPTTGGVYINGVLGPVVVQNITVADCGGTGFTFGDFSNEILTSYITANNCYVNNALSVAYKICGYSHRLNQCIMDGVGMGFEFKHSYKAYITDFHAELPETGAIFLDEASQNNIFKKGFIYLSPEAAVYGIKIVDAAGNQGNVFEDIDLIAQSTGTGLVIEGSNNSLQTVRNCRFQSFVVGVADFGTSTTLDNNDFYDIDLPINSDATDSKYINNRTIDGSGSYSIQHSGGTTGLWKNNSLDKPIQATATGIPGNFSGIIVKDNINYLTKYSGQTSAVGTGIVVGHGLAGTPSGVGSNILLSTSTSGVTSMPYITNITSTTFTINWTGASTAVWNWTANLPCDY